MTHEDIVINNRLNALGERLVKFYTQETNDKFNAAPLEFKLAVIDLLDQVAEQIESL